MDEFDKYRKAVVDGLKETEKLVEQKKVLEVRIRKISQLVAANIDMLPDTGEAEKYREAFENVQGPTGLRNAILRVLKPNAYLSPVAIRMQLVRNGYEMGNHINPLASIHTTLKRLVEAGDAEVSRSDKGGAVYKRKPRTLAIRG